MARRLLIVSQWKSCGHCGALFSKPPECSMRTWREGRPCCSWDCGIELKRGRANPKLGDYWRGRVLTPEQIAARQEGRLRAIAAKGTGNVGKGNLGRRRERTSQWKGDDIGYRTAHARLNYERPRPTTCSECGASGVRIEWALKRDAEVVKVERGKRYSPRSSDYFPLCCRCHQAYDGKERDSRTGQFV